MPTYEYECKACDHEFEIFQSMKDDTLKTCPECHKNTLKRKIGTGAGIIFKGGGFYCTDYRSDSYKKAAEKDNSSSTSSSSSSKTESKTTSSTAKDVKKAS